MTKSRACLSALAAGIFLLAVVPVAYSQNVIDITNGTQSKSDAACVAPIPALNLLDCSYDASDPIGGTTAWQGPTRGAALPMRLWRDT